MDRFELRLAIGFYGEFRRSQTLPRNNDTLQSVNGTGLTDVALWGRLGQDTARGAT